MKKWKIDLWGGGWRESGYYDKFEYFISARFRCVLMVYLEITSQLYSTLFSDFSSVVGER